MIVKTDIDAIRPWLEDASGMRGGSADRVYLPSSEAEAAELLAECSARSEKLTVAGAGTGLTGARIPMGGSVLATDALSGIRDLRRAEGGGVVVGGPAVSLADLEAAASALKLFYGPDPTERSAWIGGTVATNASGSRSFRYGPTRRHVRRLRVALATGEILDLPRGRHHAAPDRSFSLPLPSGRAITGRLPSYRMPDVKNASGIHAEPGMDLIDLFIGSEGTLGLITEIELALLPAPEGVLAGIVFFKSEEASWAFLREARKISYAARGFAGPAHGDPQRPGATGPAGRTGGLDARALEYFDGASLEFMRPHHGAIPKGAGAAIYFEQETKAETGDALVEAWLALSESHGALIDDSWFSEGVSDRRSFREFRHALPSGINEWLSRHGQRKIGADMAVGDDAFDAMFRTYRDTLNPTGLQWLAFGHLGDNHLHVNILPKDDGEAARGREIYRTVVERVVGLGGTVSAEHGLGKIKASYLAVMYGEGVFDELIALKRSFDPKMILGIGNMIPVDRLR
ncbi:MAG: FAD-binding oxidoreductase [Acidobacteria bacterium]|nr:FAD-binding oxidoreductase [Acidobacteriota bacterium]